MGVKVGPQGFQRMVSDCLKLLQPHTHIYMDHLLTRTRPQLCGKGKILDSKAYLEDHFQNVVKFFDKLEECHVKVPLRNVIFLWRELSIVGMFYMGECVVPPLPSRMRYAIGPSLKSQSR